LLRQKEENAWGISGHADETFEFKKMEFIEVKF